MILNETDIRRYYSIFLRLLHYTNEKYNIIPELRLSNKITNSDFTKLYSLRNRLWDNNEILDDICTNNPFEFASHDLKIVKSWQNRIKDRFLIIRHLDNHSIFMKKKLFGVIGISKSLRKNLLIFHFQQR